MGGEVSRRLEVGRPRCAVLRTQRLRWRGRRWPGIASEAGEGNGLRRRARPDHLSALAPLASLRTAEIDSSKLGRAPNELGEPLQFVWVRQRLVPGLGQPTEPIVVSGPTGR